MPKPHGEYGRVMSKSWRKRVRKLKAQKKKDDSELATRQARERMKAAVVNGSTISSRLIVIRRRPAWVPPPLPERPDPPKSSFHSVAN